jgi:pimeloyl-ACP methyl ester carboxylesterase
MAEIQSHPVFLTPQRLQSNLPLFVFLPGMDGTGQLLRTQTAGLEAGFDVRCLAIPLDDLTRWDVLAERVVALVEAELAKHSDRPVYLCGESFGGCLAMKVALCAPQLFDRLILINPASSFNLRPWIGWGAQLARWLPGPGFHLSSMLLLPLLGNMERMSDSDRLAFHDAVQSVPQATTIWRLSLLQEFTISRAELGQITQPTLLLASAADRLLPSVDEVRRLAQCLQNSRIGILSRSGHACLLEADVNLYEILKAYNFLVPQASKVY